MNSLLKKQITFITLLCFFNASIVYSVPDSFSDVCLNEKNGFVQYSQKIENQQTVSSRFKISLFTPYYIGKMCIYAYRFKKLKNSDIKSHVKLTKKCKKYAKKLGLRVKVKKYINRICNSLEEETGHSLTKIKKDLKKRFQSKSRKRSKSNSSEKDDFEDDIDFNNIVEKSIMEIVQAKSEISLDEYIECLRMDPDIDINEILSLKDHSQGFSCMPSAINQFHLKRDATQNQTKNLDFELSCYITLACVGGFLSMIPIPPINTIGGFMFTTGSTCAGGIIFHEYCEKDKNKPKTE